MENNGKVAIIVALIAAIGGIIAANQRHDEPDISKEDIVLSSNEIVYDKNDLCSVIDYAIIECGNDFKNVIGTEKGSSEMLTEYNTDIKYQDYSTYLLKDWENLYSFEIDLYSGYSVDEAANVIINYTNRLSSCLNETFNKHSQDREDRTITYWEFLKDGYSITVTSVEQNSSLIIVTLTVEQ